MRIVKEVSISQISCAPPSAGCARFIEAERIGTALG
jgi:hypothetical protein